MIKPLEYDELTHMSVMPVHGALLITDRDRDHLPSTIIESVEYNDLFPFAHYVNN